ncbi:hypothetical protein [Streptomyces sp. NPDC059788]|uniref:hypothetical protein n=1 Tax=Streptomyces sp. NPDC059788 TaxID=3346948 RepID=UPI003658EAF7
MRRRRPRWWRTVWPSVPVEEVVRMYRYAADGAGGGAASAPPGAASHQPRQRRRRHVQRPAQRHGDQPRTGVGARPAPAEDQLADELWRTGVRGEDVSAVHTRLRPAPLPGSCTGHFVIRAFSNARFSRTEGYGPPRGTRPECRRAAPAVERMHQLAEQPQPRPHRLTVPPPDSVERAEPVRDVELGKRLAEGTLAGPADHVRSDGWPLNSDKNWRPLIVEQMRRGLF